MSKLTPGERAVNWVKALSVLVTTLIALLGYTNREAIENWVGLTEADGETEVDRFADVQKFSKEIRAEIVRIDKAIAELEKASTGYDAGLAARVSANKKLIESWH